MRQTHSALEVSAREERQGSGLLRATASCGEGEAYQHAKEGSPSHPMVGVQVSPSVHMLDLRHELQADVARVAVVLVERVMTGHQEQHPCFLGMSRFKA